MCVSYIYMLYIYISIMCLIWKRNNAPHDMTYDQYLLLTSID